MYKFFTSYRIIRYIERCCAAPACRQARYFTREFMDEAPRSPSRACCRHQVEAGTFDRQIEIDRDANKRMQGICDPSLRSCPRAPAKAFASRSIHPSLPPRSKAGPGRPDSVHPPRQAANWYTAGTNTAKRRRPQTCGLPASLAFFESSCTGGLKFNRNFTPERKERTIHMSSIAQHNHCRWKQVRCTGQHGAFCHVEGSCRYA